MYFRAELKDLKLPKVELPEGYTIRGVLITEVLDKDKRACEQLHFEIYHRHKEWASGVPNSFEKGYVVFVEFNEHLVGVGRGYIMDGQGTCHDAMIHLSHRRKGLYLAIEIYTLQWLVIYKVSKIENHTNVKILWRTWKRLGFKEVDDIHHMAKGGKANLTEEGWR